MARLKNAGVELGTFAAAHALSSAAVFGIHGATGHAVPEGMGQKEAKERKVLLSAALALLVCSRRWTDESRQLAASMLLTQYVPLFEGSRKTLAWSAAIFMPVAAEMWIRWPDAASGAIKSVHPNFTGTMAHLTGTGQSQLFGKDPVKFASHWGTEQFMVTIQRSVRWSLRTLGILYFVQAMVRWLRWKPRKSSDEKRPGLDQVLRSWITNTLRTTAIYTALSQYSVWAYARNGHRRGRMWSLPSAVFLFEPLTRFITLAQYYVMHWVYVLISDTRSALGLPSTFPAALTALAMAGLAVIGRRPNALMFSFLSQVSNLTVNLASTQSKRIKGPEKDKDR
eukprot:Hpha_TRINITY_DN16604_c1_g2::TRINITY_DN16604_c1_g2_i1::g.183569::m.183569